MRMEPRTTPTTTLSPTEVVILQLLAEGTTQAEIALARNVSYCTVNVQLVSIKRKLGAINTCHALVIAFRRGMLA